MKIRVIEFDGLHPAPAYTDYSAVYISTALTGEQRRTALRHERAHIWLQHQARSKAFEQENGHPLDRKVWNIALDLEIARHIYTQRDDDAITEIRSALAGGIRRCHCDDYPNSLYAEEYYEAIMSSSAPEDADSMDGVASDEAVDAEIKEEEICTPQELVESSRNMVDEASDSDEKEESAKQTQRSIDGFRPPKPSLASLIDMHIGRTVRSRSDSYRRPSRKNTASDLIAKGTITKQKAPKITIYVDRSGSFSPDKTAKSVVVLYKCLMKYRGRVDCDVIYFADELMRLDPGRGIGGTNYQPVIDQIAEDMAEISLIITDSDSADGVVVSRKMPPVIVMPIGCLTTSIGKLLGAEHVNEAS